MIDPESSKEIIKEAKVLSSEIYKDLASPALKEIGTVGGRTAKALLFPVRGFLWGWEKIEAVVEDGINKRFEKISEDKRKTPDPEIAVPLIEALTYTAQNETLREMYLNLLASAMNLDKERYTHPSFVDLIKRMNSLDAKVFKKISRFGLDFQKAVNPAVITIDEKSKWSSRVPEWFVDWTIDEFTPFDISACLTRLSKFGLIDLGSGVEVNDDYSYSENNEFLNERIEIFGHHELTRCKLVIKKSSFKLNEYGFQFRRACIDQQI